MSSQLKGCVVLVSRPLNRAVSLTAKIKDEGGQVILAPMIGTKPIQNQQQFSSLIGRLSDYTSVIFISRNAVEFGVEQIKRQNQALERLSIYAVGVGSASELKDRGFSNVQTPRRDFSSEGLLQLDELQATSAGGTKILIVRGAGGREHLGETLVSRGAEVDYSEMYERFMPDICITEALSNAGATVPDIGVFTSLEGATNFVDKIRDEGLDLLFEMPILVVGLRMANEVAKLGFLKAPLIADNPSDEEIIGVLVKWVTGEL